jgi:hypothetical protein
MSVNETSPTPDCEACIQAKQTHVPFPQSTSKEDSRVPGEMTHSDVWGPARTESLRGSQYFISFTDNCTRKCTIEFMKLKSEVGVKVRQYVMQLKTRHSMQPRMIRIDNGTEYINDELISWCKDQGIEVQRTAPYSPQQNGTAERLNRTLIELARAMLIAKGLPECLWAEAVSHAAYLRNRAPTRALEGGTPNELWDGVKLNVAHLREFGSPVYVLIEDNNKSKLKPRSEKHIFVGFTDGSKSIKYYNTTTRQVKTSRNFKFLNAPVLQCEEEN